MKEKIIKKHPKKMILLVGLLAWFSVIEYQNFNGYCRAEGRYLSKEELLQRGAGKLYAENPDCCSIGAGSMFDDPYIGSAANDFLNKLLIGRYFYGIITYQKRHEPLTSDLNYPYYEKYYDITQCGKVVETTGTTISEKEYQFHLDAVEQIKRRTRNDTQN